MADDHQAHYFDLHAREQAELLQSLAPVMGRRAEILEKDIWLCLVLDALFRLPGRKPMAFKGGTEIVQRGAFQPTCAGFAHGGHRGFVRYQRLERQRLVVGDTGQQDAKGVGYGHA